ncbi:MAG: hypothetical protein ACLP78_00465 [Thermoplasmata archaeon]
MGEPRIGRSGRRYRRARRLDRGQRGVAAVIGTLLALLVFFALFGIFLTQYLPLWMTDNESEFTSQANAAMALFKSNVDAQSALDGPTVYATTFPLSSSGVPLLAQPTEANLILLPPSCPGGFLASGAPVTKTSCVFETEAFSGGPGVKTARPWNESTATAVLEMQLPNRYFTSQTFFFEDDAVIQTQYGAHSVMVGPPPFTITKTVTNTTVSTSFLGLYGNSTVVIGQGSEEVYSELVTSSWINSNGLFLGATGNPVVFNFTFQIGTHNLCPWYSYVTGLVASAGLAASAYRIGSSTALPPTSTVCSDTTGYTYDLTLKVLNIAYASALVSSISVSMGAGVV